VEATAVPWLALGSGDVDEADETLGFCLGMQAADARPAANKRERAVLFSRIMKSLSGQIVKTPDARALAPSGSRSDRPSEGEPEGRIEPICDRIETGRSPHVADRKRSSPASFWGVKRRAHVRHASTKLPPDADTAQNVY